ncbi:MAG: hypothetical protein M1833_001480 [Piccolia ochrophora]|nr:MAG: hypothetical protein M1833_001480 [Piccolia ochrophora]
MLIPLLSALVLPTLLEVVSCAPALLPREPTSDPGLFNVTQFVLHDPTLGLSAESQDDSSLYYPRNGNRPREPRSTYFNVWFRMTGEIKSTGCVYSWNSTQEAIVGERAPCDDPSRALHLVRFKDAKDFTMNLTQTVGTGSEAFDRIASLDVTPADKEWGCLLNDQNDCGYLTGPKENHFELKYTQTIAQI